LSIFTPYLLIIYIIISGGVAERWVDPRLILFKNK